VGNLFHRGLAAEGTIRLGDTGLAEIFLGQDIGSNLAPSGRDFDIVHLEYDFSTGVADDRAPVIIREQIENIDVFPGEATGELQALYRLLSCCHESVPFVVKMMNSFCGGSAVNESIF
jgi:hypothetical protein